MIAFHKFLARQAGDSFARELAINWKIQFNNFSELSHTETIIYFALVWAALLTGGFCREFKFRSKLKQLAIAFRRAKPSVTIITSRVVGQSQQPR